MPKVQTSTPPNTPGPISPYSHLTLAGDFITISATAGINPDSGELAGADVYSQAKQILENFSVMLASVELDLSHVLHINVFLKQMSDFAEMNRAYAERMGSHRPARTVIGVTDLPKPALCSQ